MPTLDVTHTCTDFDTYRAARVKSLFNAESGATVHVHADLPLDDKPWQLGVVVGPSGSGKTTIGRNLFPDDYYTPTGWPDDAPIVDAISPDGDFNTVTAALAAVGLGDVPAWLRPYPVLSNGEKFRADLARIVAEAPQRVAVDEFTSVVDRQIAQIGAGAFSKAWRRTTGQAVLLTCHYDVLDWLQPDWVYDTRDHQFTWGWDHPRPRITVEIRQGGWQLWPYFEPHHYLKAGPMPFGKCYVGFVDDQPVVHLGVSSKAYFQNGRRAVGARACRLVVLPEWQGAGVGMRMLNHICALYLTGGGHLPPTTTEFQTSHPQLCAALRRDPRWVQVSANLHGGNKASSADAMRSSAARLSAPQPGAYGGHLRAVQGFRYIGTEEERAVARTPRG